MANESVVVFSSRAEQVRNVDFEREQSTQSQAESKDKTPNTDRRVNMGLYESCEMQEPVSILNRPVYIRRETHL